MCATNIQYIIASVVCIIRGGKYIKYLNYSSTVLKYNSEVLENFYVTFTLLYYSTTILG